MSTSQPQLGIDFGTSFSSISWFNPDIGKAEIILNAEGEAKTPSAAYFRDSETLVGTPAILEFGDAIALSEGAERIQAAQRYVASIKRRLLTPPVIALPGGRFLRPQDVVAEILRKLKHDAESGHFHQPVRRVALTVPAAFNSQQRDVIEAGAKLAGFDEVTLLDEPTAAAVAFAAEGQKVGNSILVYDLGGGTCDLIILSRRPGGRFEPLLPPAGDAACGGDDFDWALYDYCEQHGLAGNPGERDSEFLAICRRAKEKLSSASTAAIRRFIDGKPRVIEITRSVYETLIFSQIERSMQQVSALLAQAKKLNHTVDTVVLIGGATRTPLVISELARVMRESGVQGEPLRFAKQDVAVALGASYSSATPSPKPPTPPSVPTPPASLPADDILTGLKKVLQDSRSTPSPKTNGNTHQTSPQADQIIRDLASYLRSDSGSASSTSSSPANANNILAGLNRLIRRS